MAGRCSSEALFGFQVPSVYTQAPKAEDVPADLSGYVLFLQPWGSSILNPLILAVMFFVLLIAIAIALRLQDAR